MFRAITAALILTAFVTNATASIDVQSIGSSYKKTEGPCANYLEVMKWYNFESSGLMTLAQTRQSGQRPLEDVVRSISISTKFMAPTGEGTFVILTNQPVPVKVEYDLTADGNLMITVIHQGKGSFGDIFNGSGGYASKNEKYIFSFSNKNTLGIYTQLDMTFQLKRRFSSRVIENCSFELFE
jgi:hypothetical protein